MNHPTGPRREFTVDLPLNVSVTAPTSVGVYNGRDIDLDSAKRAMVAHLTTWVEKNIVENAPERRSPRLPRTTTR